MQPESNRKPETNLLNLDKLIPMRTGMETLLSRSKPVVLAIDGRAASGKTSLAGRLASDYQARIVHMDDFFLPKELRTAERLAEPGGNFHYERFITDIMPGIRNTAGFSYQSFDCNQMQLGEWRGLASVQFTIVEGAYALHPKLGKYYDLSIFVSCPPETQLARLKARNPLKFEEFLEKWIPMEEAYFQAFGIEAAADYFIHT